MPIEEKIKSLGLTLPPVPKAIASYIPANGSGKLVFTSGQLPMKDGKLLYTGQTGKDVTIEQAREAMKQSCLNALSAIKGYIGDLDQIQKVVKIGAFVSSAESFFEQHIVANAASDLLLEIFGEPGKHARFAIGVNTLPLNACVELEVTVEVK
ncbi:MAG TPA: RidA family protein [Leptospiraceae bacterium]|nr:RidA family protein [Leptospiraceae bacterium]HMW04273.1 RidA family protein [Leptospiraceae bacterium]HMX30619.1 RidA family protein [Leptospiraceae bacterium]HMY31319.1 RidA family protein [Leptospiraceae bacterium]HMZ63432.1 RidA family protein [Leptospiraceae bacterium]